MSGEQALWSNMRIMVLMRLLRGYGRVSLGENGRLYEKKLFQVFRIRVRNFMQAVPVTRQLVDSAKDQVIFPRMGAKRMPP